jgi:hypothetical protein
LKIVIESEVRGDLNSLFVVTLNGKLIAEHLTAVQAQLVVAEIMERHLVGVKPAKARLP